MNETRFLYIFNDRAHCRRFLIGLAWLALFIGLGGVIVPLAHAASFSCATSGGNLFNQDTIGDYVDDASGNLYTINTSGTDTNGDPFGTGACPNNLGIVGRVLCFFKVTVGQILSSMYCDFQNSLRGPLTIAVTLALIIVGILITTGMTKMSKRETTMTLIKILLVWIFAMDASWGIGVAYSFFMGIAEMGSNVLLTAGSGTTSGGVFLTQPDKILNGVLNYVSLSSGGGVTFGSGNGFANMPSQCMVWLITLLIILLLFSPMVAGFIIGLIVQYLWIYARALLGYLTALVLMGFLFVLSPLFLSFALFNATRPIFEQWLMYLASFSMQMIIIFGFLAVMNMVPLGDFFNEVTGLVKLSDKTQQNNNITIPITFCSICSYTIDNSKSLTDNPPPITCSAGVGSSGALSLPELLSRTDFVQIIVSQVVALWIIGRIMQDFIKSAPDIARGMTQSLSAAAGMGGGQTPIEYPGLQDAEKFSQSMVDRLKTNTLFQNKTFGRLAPGMMLLGGAGLLAMARKGGQNFGKNDTPTVQQAATDTAGQMQGASATDYDQALKNRRDGNTIDTGDIARRAMSFLDPRTDLSVRAAELRYEAAGMYFNNQLQGTYQSIGDYEKLKGQEGKMDSVLWGNAMDRAREKMREQREQLKQALSTLDESRRKVWRDMSAVVMQQRDRNSKRLEALPTEQDAALKQQERDQMSSYDTPQQAGGSPPADRAPEQLPPESADDAMRDLRGEIDAKARAVEAQLVIQSYLNPGQDTDHSKALFSAAIQDLAHSSTVTGLKAIVGQLDLVQSRIT